MAVTWKKVGLVGSLPNIGNENLTIPASTNRTLSLAGAGGFQVENSSSNALLALAPASAQLGNTSDTQLVSLYMPNTTMLMINATRLVSFEETNNFVITSEANSTVAGPILTLTRERGASGGSDNDVIGKINFKGDNDIGGSIPYASVETVIIDSDNTNESADMKFVVKDKNVDQNNFTITQVGTSGDDLSSNEATLEALKIRNSTLEALTRRTQMVYQCGYNGLIQSSSTQNVFNEQMLRVSNGVQMIDGNDYTNSTGIVMPFDGYVVGGSFSCVRGNGSETTQGRIKMYLRKYTPGGTGDWDNDLELASSLTGASEPHPVSESYLLDSSEIRSDAVKVLKGDMILPYISIATQVADSDYRIDDVIAQFIIYSESTFQVQA